METSLCAYSPSTSDFVSYPLVLPKTDTGIKTEETLTSTSFDEEKMSSDLLARERETDSEEESGYQMLAGVSPTENFVVEYDQLSFQRAVQDLQEFFPHHLPRVSKVFVETISNYVKKNVTVLGGVTLFSCCLGVGFAASFLLGTVSMGLQAKQPEFGDVVRNEVWQLVGEQMREDSTLLALDGVLPKNLKAVRHHYKQLLQKIHPDKNPNESATAQAQKIISAHERYVQFWEKGYRPLPKITVSEVEDVAV